MKVTIYIEGKKYIVGSSRNLLEICLSLGFDIPYFCWHPALGSVGACRQCAVKQCIAGSNSVIKNNDSVGNIVMSCMTPVSDGMHVYLFDKELLDFRKNVLELLMINHPHDCPVCEEGGHCHLQDMTVMTGQVYRRYRFTKRTHYNQYLGPFITHEMNRCITCYRCIRYYKDYAGGDDLGVFGIHDNIYFGRMHEGVLQSEFSGNLIEVCPTGVFTDKTQAKHYARKWDMMFAPSICQQCSVGCNIILGERYGKLCRVENRYNGEVNGYFLCDLGRFGCDYVNLNNRIKVPLLKNDNNYVVVSIKKAIRSAVNMLNHSDRVIGIGSSRASIESNFALRKLVGPDNFYSGLNNNEQERLLLVYKILRNSGIHVPSLREMEDYDAIVILGEDLTQTGARIALSVRQAIKGKARNIARDQGIFDWQSAAIINIAQNVKNTLLITNIDRTKLDDLAILTYYDSPKNQARFAFAVAYALDNTAPRVEDFNNELNDKLDLAVQKLKGARKPLIISGTSSGSKELIAAAANIALSLKRLGKKVGITFVVRDVNSIGLIMIGATNSIDDAFNEIYSESNINKRISVVVLENDLYRNISSNKIVKFLNSINYLIILDHYSNLIQKKAHLILSAANFAESDGTVINYEGRAQRFFKLYHPEYYDKDIMILESWRWLYLIYDYYYKKIRKKQLCLDYVIEAIVRDFPELIGIRDAAPDASFRVHGQKLAQAPNRYSGRTAINTNISVHESGVPHNEETMFTYSMEGYYDTKSLHKQIPFAWAPGWNSPQAWNKFQDRIGGHLFYGDPGVCLFKSNDNSNYARFNWFTIIPKIFAKKKNKWLVVPYWNLFGSEETSQQSKFIQYRMIQSYIVFNNLEAVKLGMCQDMLVKFKCADQILCLPIKLSINLPVGHIGLPVGFPGIPLFFSGMYAQDIQRVI